MVGLGFSVCLSENVFVNAPLETSCGVSELYRMDHFNSSTVYSKVILLCKSASRPPMDSVSSPRMLMIPQAETEWPVAQQESFHCLWMKSYSLPGCYSWWREGDASLTLNPRRIRRCSTKPGVSETQQSNISCLTHSLELSQIISNLGLVTNETWQSWPSAIGTVFVISHLNEYLLQNHFAFHLVIL